MKRQFIVSYTYRQGLRADELRELTALFVQRGPIPGTVAHYERLDGRGGMTIWEGDDPDVLEQAYEGTIAYSPYMQFEIVPVATMESAFPVIQRMYGT
jgi:hypothetical protein